MCSTMPARGIEKAAYPCEAFNKKGVSYEIKKLQSLFSGCSFLSLNVRGDKKYVFCS